MRRYDSGLSLIELLVVLSIMAMLTTGAIAYTLPLLLTTKTQLTTDELLHHLHYARSEAIKRNKIVGICGIEDVKTCSPSWEAGYLIFVQDAHFPHQKEIIKINEHPYAHTTIYGQFNSPDNALHFTPQGRAQKNGKIMVTSKNTDLTQTIMISLTGRSRLLAS